MIMRPDVLKAVVAMESFFTYQVTPDEFVALLQRIDTQNERDRSMVESLSLLMAKVGHK